MADREDAIMLWIVASRIFRRNRMTLRHMELMYTNFLLALHLLRRRRNQRVRYCQIVGFADRLTGAILRGEHRATKDHLRVRPNSLRRLVMLCGYNRKRSGWTVEFEVIVFLFWLACGAAYRVVGAVFDIHRSTVHKMVHRILNKILILVPQVVRLPTENDLPQIGAAFAAKARSAVFSQCVGAIDGCHIRIICPRELHEQYYNRKQFYSLNLQALVDNSGKFIDILSGYPGSVHDSRIFRNSALFQRYLYPPEGYFIIGDSGYPCRRHPVTIITPFRAPLTPEQRAFNSALSRARVTVEQAFGMMEVRWRSIFTKALEVKITTSIKVIAACTVMHNICLTEGDVLPVNGRLPPLPPRRMPRDERNGEVERNLMLQLFTAEQLNH